MKPRIFVSHSNQHADATAFIAALKREAVAAELDLLVDRDHLTIAATWRDELYTWMGLANGAVIVLTPDVLTPNRPWVAREASILMWRRTLDRAFPVVPVLLGGFDHSQLKLGNFADLRIEDVESPDLTGGIEAVAKATIGRLKSLATMSPTPLERVASKVVTQLADLRDVVVREAADKLGIDLGPWNPTRDIRDELATKLLQVNLRAAAAPLQVLAGHLPASRIKHIIRLISPSWVDAMAARWVAQWSCDPSHRTGLLLNAQRMFTADMYVRRSGWKDHLVWPIVKLSGVYGENAAQDLVSELKASLTKILLSDAREQYGDATTPEQEEKDLLQQLVIRAATGDPIFALLVHTDDLAVFAPVLLDFMGQLAALPAVNVIVLAGPQSASNGQTAVLGGQARFLEPLLPPGAEDQAWNEWTYLNTVRGYD